MDILVIGAHPDDEVLGMGGTIKKLSSNNNIHLCILTEAISARKNKNKKKLIKEKQISCRKSGKLLGVSTFDFFEFPDQKLDSIPQLEINQALEKTIKKYEPEIVYTTSYHDLNLDHKCVFDSTLIVTRTSVSSVKKLLCYEIPGWFKITFQPNIYENIENEISEKIRAFKYFTTEIKNFPHPFSTESIETHASYRGIQAGFRKAEAFQLIRHVLS